MIDALPLLLGPEGYQINRSVRMRSSASAYFNRTMAPAGVTVYTFSTWVKRGSLGAIRPIVQGYLNNNNYGHIIFKADDTIEWREVSVAANYGQVNTNAVFRDPSAWYHIVVVRNGSSLTIYVNGVSQTLTVSTAVNAAAGYLFGGSTVQRIGSDQVNSAFFDGYLTECYLIDGQALTPSSFGETNAVTGVWQPKKYAGTYGTNGFYLNFSDNTGATATTIGKDYSGNGNNWTPNNISVTAGVTYDSMLDVPTQWADGGNGRGNYATLNPVNKALYQPTISDGNLRVTPTTTQYQNVFSTISQTSGKWYCEVTVNGTPNSANMIGVSSATEQNYLIANAGLIGGTSSGYGYYIYNGNKYNNGSSSAYGNSIASGDVVGIALDLDNGRVWFSKNGTWQASGDPAAGTNAAFTSLTSSLGFFISSSSYSGGATSFDHNFGQRPFAYTPPTGFKALNTLNLPTPTILKGNQYFDVSLWTGTGSAQSITNSGGMQPDFVWGKIRSGADYHVLANSVVGADKFLKSNATDAETTNAQTITAFNSNGFSVGTSTDLNRNTYTFVGWQWKEGATQGFDIVTWTGTGAAQNISHNLGVAPAMIIWKYRSAASDWAVGHKLMNGGTNPWNYWAALNSTAAQAASAGPFNNTAPTSSQFTVGSFNANGTNMVAYLFSEVAGFSKAFSYTGNGSADGPFIFTGFRPRFILIKESTPNARGWRIFDTARSPSNQAGLTLSPNAADAEDSGSGLYNQMDILSNGFKLRAGTNSEPTNESGATYIGFAWAEVPFKNSLAR